MPARTRQELLQKLQTESSFSMLPFVFSVLPTENPKLTIVCWGTGTDEEVIVNTENCFEKLEGFKGKKTAKKLLEAIKNALPELEDLPPDNSLLMTVDPDECDAEADALLTKHSIEKEYP